MAIIGPQSSLLLFVALAGLVAFAGATQDIVIDAYRIEVAPVESQAALAATYILGYRFGLIISGAIALYLAELTGWTTAYLIMAACILLPLVAGLISKEPAAQELIVREIRLWDAFIKPFQEFFSRNGFWLALALLAFVGLFKLPDQMIGVLAGPFYLDSGYTKADIATVSKVYGVWIGIAGAFLGGICIAAFSLRSMLVIAALAVSVSNVAYLLMAHNPGELGFFCHNQCRQFIARLCRRCVGRIYVEPYQPQFHRNTICATRFTRALARKIYRWLVRIHSGSQ
jgi:PAT family beta-lactamase induction signal transducer AmpG